MGTRSLLALYALSVALASGPSILAQGAAPKIRIGSDAGTAAARNAEKKAIAKAVGEAVETKEFERLNGLLQKHAPGVTIEVKIGDAVTPTGNSTAAGTFVPKFQDPKAETGFLGGTIVIDKDVLARERPNHSFEEFVIEIFVHEFCHAVQYGAGSPRNETPAREAGERAADERGASTLSGTLLPASPSKPSPKAPPASAPRESRAPSLGIQPEGYRATTGRIVFPRSENGAQGDDQVEAPVEWTPRTVRFGNGKTLEVEVDARGNVRVRQ